MKTDYFILFIVVNGWEIRSMSIPIADGFFIDPLSIFFLPQHELIGFGMWTKHFGYPNWIRFKQDMPTIFISCVSFHILQEILQSSQHDNDVFYTSGCYMQVNTDTNNQAFCLLMPEP